MRLVINSRGGYAVAGLKRYKGEGIYCSIGRKVFLSGLRKVINTMEKQSHSQKIADIVVNGRQETSKKEVKKQKQAGVKRKSSTVPTTTQISKAKKYSNSITDKLINTSGSGIILD